ncbi:NAD(P)/FAD-dependent oxidoreductase [Flavitalea sp. BT771]|uniref:NAD(P)/FAD-dependent oxidoreductase n=1 Tax=Flavitalea sp. BT771 TaxID=3063329 RepID=UPI0026E23A01|nr:NAD(P)/FAD-dependent oxidoreductase [Flavitalea sp. BT771]MDO6432181.1 NAD(P)/FAD-dependent oxidoreductase [Flavitalea sp. BT771]MDV6221091.1 NAD(P)/FAD-dependent oxidoreductase [Flavitalea sp. BT771]
MQTKDKRLVVIGGGAAGFFCAVNAARLDPSLQVILLEKTGKLLSKVKVSGGGRCNVTHSCFDIGEMMKKYPRGGQFVRKAFHQFFTTDTVRWFAERGVELHTEADGRMFPVSNSSQTIIDCLTEEVERYGVEVRLHAEVVRVARTDDTFAVHLASGQVLEASAVCIACGGYPKSASFEWIRALGHTIEEPVPSLFTFNMPGNGITKLMGLSVPEARVKIAGSKLQEKGPLLITHWGMSGPAVLRLSAWGARELAVGEYKFTALVNWTGELSEQKVRDRLQEVRFEWAAQKVASKNPFGLPARLWEYALEVCGVRDDVRWSDLPAKEANKLVGFLAAGEFPVSGKTTFKEEFVTAGGVRLAEVDPSTMQSRRVPGLFFAGEILDVDGVTGGFNFQHAWTSGWIAAANISRRSGQISG